MSLPGNRQPLFEFVEENLRYPDGRKPSKRTILAFKRKLPIVRIGSFEFVDLDRLDQHLVEGPIRTTRRRKLDQSQSGQ